ncbi:hypothetical protein AAF712_007609 [Marasmius tenuissimus]|uniref:Uncharacterized protein n=1 Tax=Marasmius tenuissimus TaxID=585030 RepID=A0ABR2ZUN5_9AGAR
MRLTILSLAASSGLAFAAVDSVYPFSPGFDIQKVASLAESLPSHSWEWGTASEALLELRSPSYSVFGCRPFPVPSLRKEEVPSLDYAFQKIVLGGENSGPNQLADGDGATGDPASLGVSAVLLGKTIPEYAAAARRMKEYLVEDAPRWENGAISHRVEAPELWADFVYMAPPFLAYYAVSTNDLALLQQSVDQCGLYREVLRVPSKNNLWKHIVGPTHPDPGLWSTGNAWAAAGMTRVLATVIRSPKSLIASEEWRKDAVDKLTEWISEIVEGAMDSPMDGGLLRNYLDDTSDDGHGYGEISGSSLIAAVVYRMAVLQPKVFGERHIRWAEGIRRTLGDGDESSGSEHVTREGIVTPAVNPLDWNDTEPFTTGSPEGQNFVVMMYAAWRDCVVSGKCRAPQGYDSGDVSELKECSRDW